MCDKAYLDDNRRLVTLVPVLVAVMLPVANIVDAAAVRVSLQVVTVLALLLLVARMGRNARVEKVAAESARACGGEVGD